MKIKKKFDLKVKYLVITFILIFFSSVGFYYMGYGDAYKTIQERGLRPSDILGFNPVDPCSSSFAIRIAQAELCRNEVDIGPDGVDGIWGCNSAMAMCEYLVKLKNSD